MKKTIFSTNLFFVFALVLFAFLPQTVAQAGNHRTTPEKLSENRQTTTGIKSIFNYSQIVYIDPTTLTPGDGSSQASPLASWDGIEIQANTAYVQKRGTTANIGSPIIADQTNVLLGAYGIESAPRPIISDGSTNITHMIQVRANFVTVRDLEIISPRATSGIHFAAGYWPSDGTVSNCSVHGVDKSHYLMWGIRVFGDRTKILNSEIYFTGDDGIFVQYFQDIEIGYNQISRVNQKWFENTSESYSGGDGVQFDTTDRFYIHHNLVDRSDTGNKFCFIVDPKGDALTGGLIENNTCVVGAGVIPIFAGGANDYAITIRNNILKSTAANGGSVGIYSHARYPLIYNNLIKNFERGITLLNANANAEIYHNDFSAIKYNGIWGDVASLTVSNNIFDINSGAEAISVNPFSASHNLFTRAGQAIGSNPVVGDPKFIDPLNDNLKLQQSSPAINAGIVVSGVTADAEGNAYLGAPDVGAFEFLVASTFADVPFTHSAYTWIERLYASGITGGCGTNPLIYCPNKSVTRAQMAVFLLRGMHGSSYAPPTATGAVFGDVPVTHPQAAWIEQLNTEGITGGCGSGNYCPGNPVTRAQMAVFLLRAKHGAAYTPPAASGTMFADVPITHPQAAWIEQLSNEGVSGGCGAGNYCPANPVTRAQMAIFLVRAFNLP